MENTLDVTVIPIEQSVEKSLLTELEKLQITKDLLEEKTNECLELKLNGQDKEAYTLIRETRLNMKTRRVAIEKICKKGREDATKTQKAWIAVEKDWVKIVSKGEDYLQDLETQFEQESERIKAEAKRKQEEEFIQRQAELTKMGAVYQDGNFVLGDVSYEAVLIKESDPEIWETMKSKFHEKYIVIEQDRLAEEKRKADAQAEFNRQQEEQQRKAKELEQREAEIKKKEQEEIDRQKQIEAQARLDLEKEAKTRLEKRANQLAALGMTFNFQYDAYVFKDVNVDNQTEICLFTDDQWTALIEKIIPVIEERKKEAEEKRLADIEEQKRIAGEEATKKERERAAEEARKAEVKRIADNEKKKAELEASDDKTKWNAWLEEFSKLSPVPTMKSPAYRTKASIAREKIEEITNI